MPTETVELEGHIVDSLLLAKVLDLILESEADYRITSFDLGRTNVDPSRAVIEVADGRRGRARRAARAAAGARRQPRRPGRRRGASCATPTASCRPASTRRRTSRPTCGSTGDWRAGREPRDGLRHRRDATTSVRTVPMHRVRAGDRVVVGYDGVRVHAPERAARRAQLRVHELRHLVGEAEGAADRAGRRPHPIGEGAWRQAARGVRTGGRAHRRRAGCGPPRARGMDRRAVRRQRLRDPRHGVERARHVARRVGRRRHAGRARPLEPPCASSTRCAATDRSRRRSRPGSSPAA